LADNRQTGPDDLDRRIASAKAASSRGVGSAEARAESRGWAVGIEFVGVVLVSGLIGWGLDHYALNSAPWAMIIMLVLGFVAGVYRVSKITAQFDANPNSK